MGYLGRGEDADIKKKQKTALEEIRRYQKRKAEAKKNGTTAKISVHKDEKSVFQEGDNKPVRDATQPMTRSDVFGLKPAKRPVDEVEDGEIPAAKLAKTGGFSDRALKPKTGSTQVPVKPLRSARLPAGQKRSPYKRPARPPAGREDASQTGPTSPPVGPKKPSHTVPGRPSTQTESIQNVESAKTGQDKRILSPRRSLKRKAEEELTGATDTKAQKAGPSAPIGPPEKPEKMSGLKPSEQTPEVATPSDKKTSRGKKSSEDEVRAKNRKEQQRLDKESGEKFSGKKRKAEDAGSQTKKNKSGEGLEKTATPETGSKSTEARQAVPMGLDNFGSACFANAVLQCLANIPELVEFYRFKAKDTVKTEPKCTFTEAQRKQFNKSRTKDSLATKKVVRDTFRKAKDDVKVQAYLGELFERMHAAASPESSVSPFDFLQALGVHVQDDEGRALDGEKQADAWEFYCRLLHLLEEEEVNSRDSHKDPTMMQTVLGSTTADILSCSLCGHRRTSGPTAALSVDIGIPDGGKATSLTQCLDAFVKDDVMEDYKCENCKKSGGVTKSTLVEQLAWYAVIKLTRVGLNGKISTSVPIPTGELDLAPWFADPDTGKDHRYEVTGVVEHYGQSFKRGHWLACKKVKDKWWHCNDHKVSSLMSEKDMTKHHLGYLFFLKKME